MNITPLISEVTGDLCEWFFPDSMAAWDLTVIVEELGPEAPPLKVSVTSELHIGGVILKIVEKTRKCPLFMTSLGHEQFGSVDYRFSVSFSSDIF